MKNNLLKIVIFLLIFVLGIACLHTYCLIKDNTIVSETKKEKAIVIFTGLNEDSGLYFKAEKDDGTIIEIKNLRKKSNNMDWEKVKKGYVIGIHKDEYGNYIFDRIIEGD